MMIRFLLTTGTKGHKKNVKHMKAEQIAKCLPKRFDRMSVKKGVNC